MNRERKDIGGDSEKEKGVKQEGGGGRRKRREGTKTRIKRRRRRGRKFNERKVRDLNGKK